MMAFIKLSVINETLEIAAERKACRFNAFCGFQCDYWVLFFGFGF